ncbi:Rha family transcriptional regulator [Acinetobacter gerneri]|uniref:Rha family transcriptional regulator n=1 Tax=Acinetobacter gerneri TaxID=202952 RepID=UPI0029366AF6|nr:Rha family transcriptional regulator [Acinetobacter gerneri]MDV2438013.1 Rha family transcriptional regulator [Acinetobacter gerneri]
MNQLTTPVLTMSSRVIAELTDKPHDNVLKLIRSLIDGGIVNSTTPQEYVHPQNNQTYIEYLCSKRDSLIIVARLSPEFTAHIVDRWQELEQQLNPVFNLPQDLPTALRALADTHEQLQQAEYEREIAIKTKAHISDKKTATAMVTASNAVQENTRLKDQIGQSKRNATTLAVERMTGKTYAWQPLNKWCKSHGVKPQKVHDDRYGKVNTYPLQAWKDIYNVDLSALFGGL